MIEDFNPYIEKLLLSEPWRAVAVDEKSLCRGPLDWDGSNFWCCKACGRIGVSRYPAHYPAIHPARLARRFTLRVMRRLGAMLLQDS